jgi:RND family efflux transporter MFP subunit
MSLFLIVGAVAAWAVLRLIRPTVTVTRAVEGPVVQAFYSTGTIQPVREFPIKSNIAGILEEVNVDKGDRVKSGDALAVIHEPALQYAMDKATAELNEKIARADESQSPVLMEYDRRISAMTGMLEIANREQARQTQALESRAGSQADLDRAMDRVRLMTMDLEATRAQRNAKKLELAREVEVARSAVNTAKWNLEQQILRAPIDGVVLDRPTSQGTRVAVNDTVMRIADVAPANLVMRAAVDEEDIARVNPDQVVRLTLYSFPGEVFSGKVQKIYDQADSERRTFEVDVKLDQPNDRLQPGMTGELAFVMGERPQTIVIPSQAVQGGAVWTVTTDGVLGKRDVQIGLTSVERSEIIKGIATGDRVVISPVGTMRPGQHVRVEEVDPAKAAGLLRDNASTAWNKDQGATFKGFK